LDKSGISEVTVALQGTLDTFALPDVLRLLASTKKTGRLVIAGNRGTGSVWVDTGSVVGSTATGTLPDAGAVEVLFELLRYAEGSFTFESGTTTPDPSPARAVEPLLADAERQLIEWREIEAVVPSMDAWVSLIGDLDDDEIVIAADRWKTIVAIGSGTSVTGVGHALKLGELDICRQVKELVEQRLVKVSTTPTPTMRSVEDFTLGAETEAPPTGTTWDPYTIEIPGVDSVIEPGEPESALDSDDHAEVEVEPNSEADVVSVVDDEEFEPDDPAEADEVAKQLASLSPKAARAVAAAARAGTDEERDAALAEADDDDEPVNRGLLLKFLSSVKS
jgi:hypothetical protein